MPKDGLPPAFVVNEEELVDKRLGQAGPEGETFNPGDLSKGGSSRFPTGTT